MYSSIRELYCCDITDFNNATWEGGMHKFNQSFENS